MNYVPIKNNVTYLSTRILLAMASNKGYFDSGRLYWNNTKSLPKFTQKIVPLHSKAMNPNTRLTVFWIIFWLTELFSLSRGACNCSRRTKWFRVNDIRWWLLVRDPWRSPSNDHFICARWKLKNIFTLYFFSSQTCKYIDISNLAHHHIVAIHHARQYREYEHETNNVNRQGVCLSELVLYSFLVLYFLTGWVFIGLEGKFFDYIFEKINQPWQKKWRMVWSASCERRKFL